MRGLTLFSVLSVVSCLSTQELMSKLPVKLSEEQIAQVNDVASKLNQTLEDSKSLLQSSSSALLSSANNIRTAVEEFKQNNPNATLTDLLTAAKAKLAGAGVQSASSSSSSSSVDDSGMSTFGFDGSQLANGAMLERARSMLTAIGVNVSQIIEYVQQNKDAVPMWTLFEGIKNYLPATYQDKYSALLASVKTQSAAFLDQLQSAAQQLVSMYADAKAMSSDDSLTLTQMKAKADEMKTKYNATIQQAAAAFSRTIFMQSFGDKLAQLKAMMSGSGSTIASPQVAQAPQTTDDDLASIQVLPYNASVEDDAAVQQEAPKKKQKKNKNKNKNKKNKNKKNKKTAADDSDNDDDASDTE